MTLSDALNAFLYSRKIRGLSDKTLEGYRIFLTAFIGFLGSDMMANNITQQDIDRYIAQLYTRNLSKATIASYTRHIKVFLTWFAQDNAVQYNVSKIALPKVNKSIVHLYSDDEIRLIFSLVTAESEWLVNRNKACIALMLDSGLRQAEACNVRYDRYDRSKRCLTVCGKGEKDRVVPVGTLSTGYINKYIEQCPFQIDEYLFLNRRGEPMTANALKLLIHKIAVKVPFEFSCHKLRHNFATNYCLDMYAHKGHMDAYSLQILLGHSDIQTTMRYIHHATAIVASQASISHLDMIIGSMDTNEL